MFFKFSYIASLISSLFLISCSSGGGGGSDRGGASTEPANSNQSPIVQNIMITDDNGGNAFVGDILSANYDYFDSDGDAEGISLYRWLRNGNPIENATSLDYQLTADDSGQTISIEITPIATTGQTIGMPTISSQVIVVENSVPVANNIIITDTNNGEVFVGDTLSANYNYYDADEDAEGTSSYRWLRNGSPIENATALSYLLTEEDSGQAINIEITPIATTGQTRGEPVTAAQPIIVINSKPLANNITITDLNGGVVKVGDTISASYDYFDADGDAEGVSNYRWMRNGVPITDAATLSYTTVESDAGQRIQFEVTPVAIAGDQTGNVFFSSEIIVHDIRLNVDRLEGPGRLDITWDTTLSADSFNLYYAKNTMVDSSNFDSVLGAVVVENVSSPWTIPAAFNEYQNVYFTIEAIVTGESVLKKTTHNVFSHVEINRYPSEGGGCALANDKLYCWALNSVNQLNLPVFTNPSTFSVGSHSICVIDGGEVICRGYATSPPTPLSNPTVVSVGHFRDACAIDDTGLVCWSGRNSIDINVPLVNPRYVEVSTYLTCVLDDTGVVCMQDGNPRLTPTFSNPVQVTLGEQHRCVLDDSGVTCWGGNTDQSVVPDLVNPTIIDAGYDHTCALTDAGVVCWGGDTVLALDVPPLENPRHVYAGYRKSCAIDDTGLVCWGEGIPSWRDSMESMIPLQIDSDNNHNCVRSADSINCWGSWAAMPEFSNPMDVSVGSWYGCAIDQAGVSCWPEFSTPAPSLTNPREIQTGVGFACALDDTGTHCWGDNNFNQTLVPPLLNPTRITASDWHACAIDENGVSCWGRNYEGQTSVPNLSNPYALGASRFSTCSLDDSGLVCWGRIDPELQTVPALLNPTKIEISTQFACTLDDEGVKCWGANYAGQTDVPILSNVYDMSVGHSHACALDEFGVICWGWDYYKGFGWRSNPRY